MPTLTREAPPAGPLADPADLAEHMAHARAIAWKFARGEAKNVPAEDLVSEALLGLAYAAAKFDPARNVPFKKYATMVICHRLRHLNTWWRRRQDRERPMPTLAHSGEDWQPPGPEDPDADGQALDRANVLERVRRILPPADAELVRLHCCEGVSLAEVARRRGVTRQRVSQRFARVAARLRRKWHARS